MRAETFHLQFRPKSLSSLASAVEN